MGEKILPFQTNPNAYATSSELFKVEEPVLGTIESGHRAKTTELKSFLGNKLI